MAKKSWTISGIDAIDRCPRQSSWTKEELISTIKGPLRKIIDMVEQLLAEISPELLVDTLESGNTLSGGAALTFALASDLEQAMDVDVRIVSDPRQAVVRACHLSDRLFSTGQQLIARNFLFWKLIGFLAAKSSQ